MLTEIIEKAEDVSLNNEHIRHLLQDKVTIILYSELEMIYSKGLRIDTLFKNNNRVVLLYELESTNHWISIIRSGNTIMVYDSYGLDLDEELNFAVHKGKYLTALIKMSDYKVSVNREQMQQFKEHVNTCGRWAIVRCVFSHVSNDKFNDMIKKYAKKSNITPDELVTTMTILVHNDDSSMYQSRHRFMRVLEE